MDKDFHYWQLATGNWPLATGHWQLATGNWQLATGNCFYYCLFPNFLVKLPISQLEVRLCMQ
jgi:hypothetical protein